MLTFGLVVEGIYDEAVLTELIQKCASRQVEVLGRPCDGVARLMRSFSGYLQEFRHAKEGAHVDKALVIRDAGNKGPQEVQKRMWATIANRKYLFPVKLLVVVRELETWLLADENAISAATGRRVARIHDPESVRDPKETLERILSQARVPYTAQVARKIAENAKVKTIESRCPSFKKFREAVLDC